MEAESRVDQIRETVRRRYAARALEVIGADAGCCEARGAPSPLTELQVIGADAASCCSGDVCDPVTSDLYTSADTSVVPADALKASLGCGNPTALASLAPGEFVLDLGSGGGIDVLLAAQRVGPTGFVYGLDMTDEMLELAERNRDAQGAENVRFLKGHIEAIPLPDNHVDVVISNCVINLSADKGRVLQEACRVLKPGGRLAVSDVVVQGTLPEDVRRDMEAWVGCIAGALEEVEYRGLLAEAGFTAIGLDVTRTYDPQELAEGLDVACCGAGAARDTELAPGQVVSAFVHARKPALA